MIHVRELPNGQKRYDARLRGTTNRVVTRTFRLRKDAERWQRQQLDARDRGDWVDHRLGRQTLAEWWAEWWPSRTELRPSSRARDEAYYRNHVIPAFGDTAMNDIDYSSTGTWVAGLSDHGLAPATVHRCHQLLSKLLAGAVKARRLQRNPCSDTDNLPSVERHEMRIITPTEIRLLADMMYDVTVVRLTRNVAGNRPDNATIERVAERFAAFVIVGG